MPYDAYGHWYDRKKKPKQKARPKPKQAPEPVLPIKPFQNGKFIVLLNGKLSATFGEIEAVDKWLKEFEELGPEHPSIVVARVIAEGKVKVTKKVEWSYEGTPCG